MNDNEIAYRDRLNRIVADERDLTLDTGASSTLLAVCELQRIADTLENIERILMRTFKA